MHLLGSYADPEKAVAPSSQVGPSRKLELRSETKKHPRNAHFHEPRVLETGAGYGRGWKTQALGWQFLD